MMERGDCSADLMGGLQAVSGPARFVEVSDFIPLAAATIENMFDPKFLVTQNKKKKPLLASLLETNKFLCLK